MVSKIIRILIFVALISLALAMGMHEGLRHWLFEVVVRVRGYGLSGSIVFAVVYIVSVVAFLPASVLTLSAGFLYGPYWAFVLVLGASWSGAILAFLLSRYWVRHWVEKQFQNSTLFLALNQKIEEKGWPIVFLLRLSPLIPFSMLNYALGTTRVSLKGYALATGVGMIPGVILYCYIGSLMSSLGEASQGAGNSGAQRVFFWGGLIATVIVTFVLTKWAKRALGDFKATQQEGE